jgi:anti-sigma-K factor RskA
MILVSVALQWKISSLNSELQLQSTQIAEQTAANARAREVLDVLTAPAAQRVILAAAKTPPAPTARAVYLPSRGALILQASNLAAIPEGKTYELWVIPATGAPIPAGLFRPDASGSASVVLPELPKGVPAKAFGVTIENAGGAATPTAPIVLSGAAPAAGE